MTTLAEPSRHSRQQVIPMSYRADKRNLTQFKRDIKIGNETERKIINMYKEYFMEVYGLHIDIQENGCDNSGEFLEEDQISSSADFIVNGQRLEVKFNNEKLSYFHIKERHIHSYIKQGASVLWVNGWKTKRPRFTVIDPRLLIRIVNNNDTIRLREWGNKEAYRLYAEDYQWHSF